MKILITGAFGFVGTNLSAYLAAKGHELWALDVENGQEAIGNKQGAIDNKQSAIGNERDSRQDAKTFYTFQFGEGGGGPGRWRVNRRVCVDPADGLRQE